MVGWLATIRGAGRKNEVLKQRPLVVAHQVSGQADLHSRYQLESRQGPHVNPFCQHGLELPATASRSPEAPWPCPRCRSQSSLRRVFSRAHLPDHAADIAARNCRKPGGDGQIKFMAALRLPLTAVDLHLGKPCLVLQAVIAKRCAVAKCTKSAFCILSAAI